MMNIPHLRGLALKIGAAALLAQMIVPSKAGNVANGDFEISGSVNWTVSSVNTSNEANYTISIAKITKRTDFRLIGGSQPTVRIVASKQSFSVIDSNPSAFSFITLAFTTGAYLADKGYYQSNFYRSGLTYNSTSNADFSGTYYVGILVTDESERASYYGGVNTVTFTTSGGSGSGTNTSTASGLIYLTSPSGWSIRGSKITIRAARVGNSRTSGTSGTLRLNIWATKKKYRGGTLRGRIIGDYKMSPLPARSYYPSVNAKVKYRRPSPRRRYYTVIALSEYTSAGWILRDYRTFSGRSLLGR